MSVRYIYTRQQWTNILMQHAAEEAFLSRQNQLSMCYSLKCGANIRCGYARLQKSSVKKQFPIFKLLLCLFSWPQIRLMVTQFILTVPQY